MCSDDDILDVEWSAADYAARTQRVYALCKAWFEGLIESDDFYYTEEEISEIAADFRVVCAPGPDAASAYEAAKLTAEFEMVANMAACIITAAEELFYDGHPDGSGPCVRAMYFAREWSELSGLYDGMPAAPVHCYRQAGAIEESSDPPTLSQRFSKVGMLVYNQAKNSGKQHEQQLGRLVQQDFEFVRER